MPLKIGQHDLNSLINHQTDINEILVRYSSKKGYLSLFKSF